MMSRSPRFLASMLAATSLLGSIAGGSALFAAPEAEELQEARDAFQDAWMEASEQTRKSADLQTSLRFYDEKVRESSETLDALTRERRSARARIVETQKLIKALSEQLDAVHASNLALEEMLGEQKEEFVSFVRFIALSDVVTEETGPVAGGTITRSLTQGSLGEIVERDLYNDALLRTRATFFSRLHVLREEGDRAEERLQDVAESLQTRLIELLALREELFEAAGEEVQELHEHQRTRDLTAAELSEVKATVDEVNARVVSMQKQLLEINDRLRSFREEKFTRKINELTDRQTALGRERDEGTARRQVLLSMKQEALDAHATARANRNTVRKQYQFVEDAKRELRVLEARLVELQALPEEAPEDDDLRDAYRSDVRERDTLPGKIAFLREKLALLEDGIPEADALAYLAKRDAAMRADAELKLLDVRLREIDAERAALDAEIVEARNTYEEERAAANDVVGEIFIWPVLGRVTAGYFDSSYEQRFKVPHRGMDIAAPHGSPVFSVADGVVHTVRDGGQYGYTYVLIGHRGGYSSLYGHLSKVYVSPGSIVTQGQVIGLSGGTPGTYGAGLMTTGPHLHLEMHKDGKHINPASMLP